MSRVSTNVLIILILINGAVGIVDAAGLQEDAGVNMDTGVGESMDKSIQAAQDGFSPGAGIGQTLFGLFVSIFFFFDTLIQAIFSAPTLFMNLGFPGWFVVPIFAPMYIIAALDLGYAVTGRDLS